MNLLNVVIKKAQIKLGATTSSQRRNVRQTITQAWTIPAMRAQFVNEIVWNGNPPTIN